MPTIPESLAIGMQHHQAGRWDAAEQVYRQILARDPDQADAIHLLGMIASARGDHASAVAQIERAIKLKGTEPAFHNNLGNALKALGKRDDAVASYRRALQLKADFPEVLCNLGDLLKDLGRLDEAVDCYRRALRLRPNLPLIQNNLGVALIDLGRLDEALVCFHHAVELKPDFATAHCNMGNALKGLEKLDEAHASYQRAIELKPDFVEAHSNLGNAWKDQGKLVEAVSCYRRAIELKPDFVVAHNNLANALKDLGKLNEAVASYQRALDLKPDYIEVHCNLGVTLREQGKLDEAMACCRQALELKPDHVESHIALGQSLMQLHKLEQAEACFRKAIEIDPASADARLELSSLYAELGEFAKAEAETAIALKSQPKLVEGYYQLTTLRKGNISETDLQAMTAMLDDKYLGDSPRSRLNFALGVVYDKRRDFATAGCHFQAANSLQRAAWMKRNETNDPAVFSDWTNRVIATFSADLIDRLKGAGHTSHTPIFVVGLPRSGTTLTEQILASHPAIHGAGELEYLTDSFEKLPATLGLKHADPFIAMKSATPEALIVSAEAYLKNIREHAGDAPFIVDKMPDNLNLLGWIHLIFPHAKIIHCRRDLRDMALSCWQTSFGVLRWANDWHDIARRFIDSQRLVKHWKSIHGIDWLDFPYESVIEDTETHARRLIDYIGLDWDANCLNFHETRRPVRTASQSQVREPIYKSSIAKWRNYEHDMAPFLDEMSQLGYVFT